MNMYEPNVPRPDPEGSVYRPHLIAWERHDRYLKLKEEMERLIEEADKDYVYTHEDGDLMPREVWLEAVSDGMLIDYDGYGHPYKDGYCSNLHIRPSEAKLLPSDATHVMWFNR